MARARTLFACTECGAISARWEGRCATCGAWNALVEEAPRDAPAGDRAPRLRASARPLGSDSAEAEERLPTGFAHVDRVLGGGFVAGGVYLLGGEPGVGKSTLVLQIAARLAADRRGLYVTAEESPTQIEVRARRLGVRAPGLDLLGAPTLEAAEASFGEHRYDFVVVDSIQMMRSEGLAGAAGGVGQVRECAARLGELARERGTVLLLVSHVTKEGGLAGPKILEHMVDAVLDFEGDPQRDLRILRCSKNRFGPTAEVAVFAMTGSGLEPVEDPAQRFLSQAVPAAEAPSGCAVTCLLEGSTSIFVEVQALVTRSAYGVPQRVAQGVDGRRLALLLAVLERRAGVTLGSFDVFVKAAGGIGLREPAADFAVVAALAGSHADLRPRAGWIFLGEVGLGGELRAVPRLGRRLEEAARLGFRGAIVPAAGETRLSGRAGLRVARAGNLEAALRLAFPDAQPVRAGGRRTSGGRSALRSATATGPARIEGEPRRELEPVGKPEGRDKSRPLIEPGTAAEPAAGATAESAAAPT